MKWNEMGCHIKSDKGVWCIGNGEESFWRGIGRTGEVKFLGEYQLVYIARPRPIGVRGYKETYIFSGPPPHWPIFEKKQQIHICFTGSQKIMFSVKKLVVVKDIGPFIPANCTESRGGPNGPIPGPQNPPKSKTKSKTVRIGLSFWQDLPSFLPPLRPKRSSVLSL